MQTQLDTETSALDLSSEQTVLEYTQSGSDPVLCRVRLAIGDADKPLDGTGGNFTVRVVIDDVEVFSASETVAISAASTQAVWQSSEFTLDEDSDLEVLLTSPNAADSDVNVTATLYGTDVSADYETLTTHLQDATMIGNMALGHLGDLSEGKRLASFSRAAASTPAQHACLDFYDEAKRQMLAYLEWSCSTKALALTVSDDTPVLSGQWSYKYARPSDCLILRKIIDTSGREYAWDRVHEARAGTAYNDDYICTNLADAVAKYTIMVGENEYLPGMALMHSMFLAEMIAMTVAADEKKALMVTQKLQLRVERLAAALGATEGYVKDEHGNANVTGAF